MSSNLPCEQDDCKVAQMPEPADLHRQVRVMAAERDIKMTAVVIGVLETYFADR